MLEVITQTNDRNEMHITLKGRLDSNTIFDFSDAVPPLDDIKTVILDFEELEYISSAGLRVLLSMQRKLFKQGGELKIKNPNDTVMEIFEVTAFSELFEIDYD